MVTLTVDARLKVELSQSSSKLRQRANAVHCPMNVQEFARDEMKYDMMNTI